MGSRFAELFAELKRRKVFHVAVLYAAVGFGVIEAAEIILPRLAIPDMAVDVVLGAVLLGFPIALVLAWAYEIRPEGSQAPVPEARRVPDSMFSDGKKSIIVLPFDNMSPDPGDRYLGDGLTEELTAKLSKLGSLRVISRTSAIQFKQSGKEVSSFARDLNVQFLLEGSVRKAGEDLRITAQLIGTERDEHLWAESYSGSVEDVFGMQERVSLAIVEALRLELTPTETRQLQERPFQSLQAYQFYVQARADYMLGSEAALDRALETAALGLSTVGENELLLVARGMALFQLINGMLKSPARYQSFLDEASECAERALALNPSLAPAHSLKGFLLFTRGDPAGSIAEFTKAYALDPNDPEALLILGYQRAAAGWELAEAREYLAQLEYIDPLTPLNAGAQGWVDWYEGDFGGALNRLSPWWNAMDEGNPWLIVRAYLEGASGDRETAARTIRGMRAHAPEHLASHLGSFLLHAWRGEVEEARAAVTGDLEIAARFDDAWPLYLASGYATTGDLDRALAWLDHAVDHGVANVRYLRDHDPFLANLRGDARFEGVLAKAARLSTEHAAAAASARALAPG